PDEPVLEGEGTAPYTYTTDEGIAFFQARVAKDPRDYISLRYLGELYERKARESDDSEAFAQAEAALRKSLALSPRYARARASLAAVLCARHRFAEAREIVAKLAAEEPKDIDALAILGDAQFELGRYDEAEATYKRLHELAQIPEAVCRLANIAELKGQAEQATRLMGQAAEMARKAGGPKAAAWYQSRLGDYAFDAGKLDEAAALYETVPKGVDPYHDATYGLARIRAAQGRTDEAIELYKRA